MSDSKQAERDYYSRLGEDGRRHALRKPYSDPHCLEYLANITALMALMRPPPARIAEFGCGTGWLGFFFAERGYEIVGIDISADAIAMAEQLRDARQLTNASYLAADYEDVHIDPPVDYVIFHDALHHAESEESALRAAYAALKPGGMVLCIEPGEGHSQAASSRRAVAEFGVHEKDMPPRTIIRHARLAGFRRHQVLPWPWFHLRSAFHPIEARHATAWGTVRRRLRSVYRILRYLLRPRRQGVVLLWKE